MERAARRDDTAVTHAGDGQRENVLIVHWHDLGRQLGAYGHPDVASPRLDRLAAEGIRFTRAHATAPQCSPSRGSLFTGRYPQTNGLIGLAHHGWEYRSGVRTLPQILGGFGWHSALFGMQHETSHPQRLGFDEFDVSDSYCDHVADGAGKWLRERAGSPPGQPFLLTAGFFEVHRPYPRDRYVPAEAARVDPPAYLPDTPQVRGDLAGFYGAIAVADAAVGRLLDTLAETGLDASTWVVFFTDHGPAFPRAKSTLYDAGTGIGMIIRPPGARAAAPRVYDELFSGVDLVPTLLGLLGLDVPDDVDGVSHADVLLAPRPDDEPVRDHVFTSKTYHDSFDPIRAIRTKHYSYIENYAARPLVDLPRDVEESPSGAAVAPFVAGPRPDRELYDLRSDPTETTNLLAGGGDGRGGAEQVATELALRLNDWRQRTADVIPSDFAGTRIASRRIEAYLRTRRDPGSARPASREAGKPGSTTSPPTKLDAMSGAANSYLVCATQRSGSTLLVESLRASGCAGDPEEFFQYLPSTGMAPQPREWFAGVDDESILRLLDPLVPGIPDTTPPAAWREDIRRSGRTPNGVWGAKLMWNQTALLLRRASRLPDRSGEGLRSAIRDVIGGEPVYVHVHRPDVVSQAVSFWRAVQTQVWRGHPDPQLDARAAYHAGAIGHVVRILRDQEQGWRAWFAAERITPIDIAYPALWRNLTPIVGDVLEALGQDRRRAPGPMTERQADERSDEWAERYRHEAPALGLPT